MSPKADAYQVVTDRIIEALEQGHIPWRKPWKSVRGAGPTSLSTGREYRGINVWILSVTAHLRGYSSQYWGTYKQISERGGQVRKGETGTQVVLWKPVRKEAEDGSVDRFLVMKYFTVFNLDQADGIEMADPDPLPERDPIEACEAIVRDWAQRPETRHGGNRAYYSSSLDYVQMPEMGQFVTSEHYYGTLFHEYAHATGHESRLARDTMLNPAPFGSEDYSKEELVAEFAAAFLRGEAGIENHVEHSAGYIENWLSVLKNDRKLLVSAAAKAQKAADHILGIEPVSKEEEPNGSPRSVIQRRRNHARLQRQLHRAAPGARGSHRPPRHDLASLAHAEDGRRVVPRRGVLRGRRRRALRLPDRQRPEHRGRGRRRRQGTRMAPGDPRERGRRRVAQRAHREPRLDVRIDRRHLRSLTPSGVSVSHNQPEEEP